MSKAVSLFCCRLLAVGWLILAAGGCSSSRQAQIGEHRQNLLGVVESRQPSYRPASPTTVALSAREFGEPKKPTGTEVRLLWGLITLQDY